MSTENERDEIAWLENRQAELRARSAAGDYEGCEWLFTDELEENRRAIAWLRDDSPTRPSIFRPYGVGWNRYAVS